MGGAPQERTELEGFKQTTPASLASHTLCGFTQRCLPGEGTRDGHFSGIDPWSFHLLGVAPSQECAG